jgi:hypothetical protein
MRYDYKKNRVYFLENEMQRCELVYLNRTSNIILFSAWALGFILLSKAVKEDKSIFNLYTKKEHRRKIIKSLDDIYAFENIKIFQQELYEKSYLDLYQAFEYFILDCYRSIFLTFPKFVRIYNNKGSVPFDLSDKVSIDNNEVKFNNLIEKTLENISRASIKDQINAFNKLPINIKITKSDLDHIIKTSKTRNQLVHNDGRISIKFISELDNLGIKHNYKNGEYLLWDTHLKKRVDSNKSLFDRTIKKISTRIAKSKQKLKDFNTDYRMSN